MFLRDKRARRLERVQLIQEGSGAVLLLQAGISGLGQPFGRIVSTVQVAIAVALLVSIVRELRGGEVEEPEHSSGITIGWVNLFAGAALTLEGIQKIGAGSKLIHRPYFLQAAISLSFAFFASRIERFRAGRRVLRLNDGGVDFRLNPLRRFRAARADVEFLEMHRRTAILVTREGRRRIDLGRLENAAEVETALRAWAEAAGVSGDRSAVSGR